MHRILIVDDEKVERNGIKFLLGQMGLPIEITEASNGKEALEYLKEYGEEIDIVFTDIKMPFIDGIQLIKEVRQLEHQYKIIIFSGYSEFEYAQFAMKMGVQDYILKPVDPNEFEKTIRKVISELEDMKLSRLMQEETLEFVREHILYSLINGKAAEDAKEKAGRFVDVSFADVYKRMILFEFNNTFFGRGNGEFVQELQELLSVEFQYINLNLQQGVLLFAKSKGNDFRKIGQHIYEYFKLKYSSECFVAISSEWEDGAMSLPFHFEEVEELMENKFYQTDSHVFMVDEKVDDHLHRSVDDDTYIKQMQQDIKMKDITRLREHFGGLKSKYKGKNNVSQVYIKFIFSNLLKVIYDQLPNTDADSMKNQIDLLYRATDFQTVIDLVEKNIRRLEEVFSYNPHLAHREVESIKEYIYENYQKELSVEQLAEQVYMAPSYLSHVFKKETGQNLSKFIKAYRMEKAKEMLETTHMKIVNISYEVGYSNVSYFCQSFREYFGVSPQKFRDQGVADEGDISEANN